MTVDALTVRISEVDIEILYLIARGKVYKEIACEVKMRERTIKNRMANLRRAFGAQSMPHLIALLIASDVLRLQDLYQEFDVHVFEYIPHGTPIRSYRLTDVRARI